MTVVISARHALLRKDVFKMFEIKGKITTAICYAKVVEDEAIGQIRRMCDHDLTKGRYGFCLMSMQEKAARSGRL